MSSSPPELTERERPAHPQASDIPALLDQALVAAERGDGHSAMEALANALIAASDKPTCIEILRRVEGLAERLQTETETAVTLFLKAEERFGPLREVLVGRAHLHEMAGHHDSALAALQKLGFVLDDPKERSAVWERMGDLARTHLGQPQQALIHYQAAFREDRRHTRAVRKAITIYLELGREEQAKQLIDLEVEQWSAGDGDGDGDPGGASVEVRAQLASLYVQAGQALLLMPSAHDVARDAAERALRLVPSLEQASSLLVQLNEFPVRWKDHVRALRDAALGARDKQEAAHRYLAIAHILATYAPDDPQIEHNIKEKCLLLSPGYRPALKFLEQRARHRGELTKFLALLREQGELVKAADVSVDVWLFTALILAECNAPPDELAAVYERVRRIDARNTAALHALSELHLEHGRYADAAAIMEAFVRESTDLESRKNVLRQLARIRELELHDIKSAAQTLEQLQQLDPADDSALEQLANLYERTRDDARLAEVLEQRLRPGRRLDTAVELEILERLLELLSGTLDSPERALKVGCRLFVLRPRAALETELLRLSDALGRTADLAESFAEAAQRATSAAEGRRMRFASAHLFERSGDGPRARAVLEVLLHVDPDDRDAQKMLGRLLEQASDGAQPTPEGAVEIAEEARQPAAGPWDSDERTDAGSSLQARRRSVRQQAAELAEEGEPDRAFALLLAHLEDDALDDAARAAVEGLAGGLRRHDELLHAYRSMRLRPHGDIAALFSERIIELSIERGDLDGALEALEFLAQLEPRDPAPWERMAAIHERRNNALGVASCLERLAALAEGDVAARRLIELADYCFDVMEDDGRGVAALRAAVERAPQDDALLARLEQKLRSLGAELAEIIVVVAHRAALQPSASGRAALLLEHAALLERIGDVEGTIASLVAALDEEPDGRSTPRVTERLRSLAVRDDTWGAAALDALVAHHRSQAAWQPLADALVLLAGKRDAGEARAAVQDEISALQEAALRAPRPAFLAAARALREAPDERRLARLKDLAATGGSGVELVEVLEGAAGAARERSPELALRFLRDAAQAARLLTDRVVEVRIAESILRLAPFDQDALAALEQVHRSQADQQALVAVFRRRVDASADPMVRRDNLMEMSKILVGTDDAQAEQALRAILLQDPQDTEALRLLDELYERTGNSALLSEVLESRISLEALAEPRVALRARLGLLKLRRRGDPAGAFDELARAVSEAPHVAELRRAMEVLLEHARASGSPPVAPTAALFETVLRAHNDLAAVPAVAELRLAGDADPEVRASSLLDIAHIQEHLGQPALAFMAVCRAIKAKPEDDSLRAEAERLAQITDNLEALAVVYEDLLDDLGPGSTKVTLLKRVAQISEQTGSSSDAARERLAAAVEAGADDTRTLQELVRLTRLQGKTAALSQALEKLAMAAMRERLYDLARQACQEKVDVDEGVGDIAGAIDASRALLALEPRDGAARSMVERLLNRGERWAELDAHLVRMADEAPTPQQRGQVLARLGFVRLENARDVSGGLQALRDLAAASPGSEAVTTLAMRLLMALSGDTRAEATSWRAEVAELLEPRLESAGAWGDLAPVLRMKLDVVRDPTERRRLWLRIADVEERLLERPEQAMMTLARALGEDPADVKLRERAERLSVRLHDLESLLGVYEDIIENLSLEDPQRYAYALRAGELYEGGVGQPLKATEFYELALEAATVQGMSLANRQKVIERIERLLRAVGEASRLAAVLKRKAELAEDPTLARTTLFEAATIELAEVKDFAAAAHTLNSLLEIAPQDTQVLRALAEASEKQGRWDKVAEVLERELAVLGPNARARAIEARFKLGVTLDMHLSLPEDAMVQFQAVLQEAPDHRETREYLEGRLMKHQAGRFDSAVFLTQSYERTGDWQKAVEVLQAQLPELERRGERKEIRALLLRIAEIQQENLGNPSLAFATLCRALKNDSNDPALRAQLSAVAAANELSDELAEILGDEANAADSEGRGTLAAELREAAAELYAGPLRDPARAIRIYEGILESQPGRTVPLEALTALYDGAGRFEDLEKVLRRRLVFQDEPAARLPLLLALAGALVDKLGRAEDALPLLEEARRHDPGNGVARRLLIDLCDAQGNFSELRSLLEEEIAACVQPGEAEAAARAKKRLAVLLAEQLQDVAGAIPIWEELRAQEARKGSVSAKDVSFTTLERLYATAGRHSELRKLYEAALKGERDPALVSTLTTRLGEVLSVHLGGKEEAAARHLKVLELDPHSQASLHALRALFADLGRHEELVALLRKMMRTTAQPEQLKDLRFQLAEVLGAQLHRRAEAVEAGRRILDIEPHTAAEFDRLAAIFRVNEAWSELADVLERSAGVHGGEERIARLLELARVHEEKLRRRELAASPYERILKMAPGHEEAYAQLCRHHIEHNDWQKLVALKDDRAKRAQDPRQRIALLREIGTIYEERLVQKPLAFLAAARAFREDWNDAELAAWTERLALETDSVDELISIYDEALGNLTDERRITDTHLRMAELAWKHLAAPADAEKHYRRALDSDPRNSTALDGMVALYQSQGKWREVVQVFERQVEQSEDVGVRIAMLRRVARTLEERAEDVDGSINAYRRILELDGADVAALRDYAALLERAGRWQALIGVLRRQEELASSRVDALAVRLRVGGLTEHQLESPEKAIAIYQSILEEEPGHLQSLKALERLFTALNRPRDLVQIFEKLVELAPSPEEATRLLFKIGATWEETLDDLGQAVDANRRALQADPRSARAIENLERLQRAGRDWAALVEIHARHLELAVEPRERLDLHLAMGRLYARELGDAARAEEMYKAALAIDRGSQDAIHALGALYEKSGNWRHALEKLRTEVQLLGSSPAAADVHHRMGSIHAQELGDVAAAAAAYRAALDIDPRHLPSIRALKGMAQTRGDHPEVLHWLREESRHSGDAAERTALHTATGLFLIEKFENTAQAAEEFEKALAITPDHMPAVRQLAELSFTGEQWARAEQLLDILVERLDPLAEGAELCRQHCRLAYVCEKLGREPKALRHYQRAYEQDATFLPALEGLGAALSHASRWDDAAKIYQAILIHHRDGLTDAEVVDYHQQVADLHYKTGQPDRAIKSLEKALELNPTHPPSLRLLAQVHAAARRHEDAYEVLVRLVPLLFGDERVQILVEIGRMAAVDLEDPYRAIDSYEDANRQRPGDKTILESLFRLYRQARQAQRALDTLEELVRIEQDDKARVRLNHTLGEVYRDELKNEQRAVAYFNAALDLDPNHVQSLNAIETTLSASGNWSALAESYIAMIKRIPDQRSGIKGVLWKNLGDLYRFRLKNLEGATQAYRVIVRMSPENAEAVEALAELLARNPATLDDAFAGFQRLVQMVPDKLPKALHEMLRIALAKQALDRVYVYAQILKVLGEATAQELETLALYQRQVPTQAKRKLSDKLWEALLVHPQARGALALLSAVLWRAAGSALALQPKDFGIDRRRGSEWEQVDLDAPVQTYFVNQLKHVRSVLDTGPFDLFQKANSADTLTPLCLAQPTLALGKASPLLADNQARRLWFTIARQLTSLRPAYMLPRTMGAARFGTLVDVAVKFVDPRYPVRGDAAEIARFERALALGGTALQGALRPAVTDLLQARQAVNPTPFLEGMEHTAIRAAYLLTGDLELCLALLKQPDPGTVRLAYSAKVKELLLFAVSEEHFELRQRLGLAVGS